MYISLFSGISIFLFCRIESSSFTGELLYILLQETVPEKLFNYDYRSHLLKSTAMTFKFKKTFVIFAFHYFIIFLFYIINGIEFHHLLGPLIYPSRTGHAEIAQLLHSQPGIEINCKDISIYNNHSSHFLFVSHIISI